MNRRLICFIAAGGLLLAGCDKDDSTGPSTGQGEIAMSVIDAAGPYGQVNIVVQGVEVHKSGADDASGWLTVRSDTAKFDLLKLVNGASSLLGRTRLDAGQYTQIRLAINSASVVLLDGSSHTLTIPSTALKLNHPFTIEEGNLYELYLDFDAERSVKLQGGSYKLNPVIRVQAAVTSGTISGTALPLAARAKVWTVAGTDTISTYADTTNGAFKLMALPGGASYAVRVMHTAGTFADTVLANVAVTARQNTSIGTVTLR